LTRMTAVPDEFGWPTITAFQEPFAGPVAATQWRLSDVKKTGADCIAASVAPEVTSSPKTSHEKSFIDYPFIENL
jgi:hypothetical protein